MANKKFVLPYLDQDPLPATFFRQDLTLKVVKMRDLAKLPVKVYEDDAGYDIFSDEGLVLAPNSRALVHTGIKVGVPKGWAFILKEKSGLALKDGVDIKGGVIDATYRGELCVIVRNGGNDNLTIAVGQKIVQGLLLPIGNFPVEEVSTLDQTLRDTGGFGSTGKV